MKKLKIFDFDDTLAKSETPVIIRKADGTSTTLTPAEFATYEMKPGDTLDFTYFNKIIKNATPIKKNVMLLKKFLQNPGKYKVTILTARALGFPIRRWLKSVVGEDVYVVGVAGSNPKLKADYIEKEIQKGYKDIFFIDDSQKNVDAINNLKNIYPEVNIDAVLAETYDIYESDILESIFDSEVITEAEYRGRKVKLGKPFRTPGGSRKFAVYVKNKKGNIVKVGFGDPGMRVRNASKGRAKSFRARHKCDQKKDRTSAGYWSCNVSRYRKQLGLSSKRPW